MQQILCHSCCRSYYHCCNCCSSFNQYADLLGQARNKFVNCPVLLFLVLLHVALVQVDKHQKYHFYIDKCVSASYRCRLTLCSSLWHCFYFGDTSPDVGAGFDHYVSLKVLLHGWSGVWLREWWSETESHDWNRWWTKNTDKMWRK